MLYNLPSGEYHVDFLRGIAMAVHLKLLQPSELDAMFQSGKTQHQIANICLNKIKENIELVPKRRKH